MGLNEADTRAKLIDPKIHNIGWKEDLIRRETTAGTIEIINGRTKRKGGRTDYILCLPAKDEETPLSIAILEAKKDDKHTTCSLSTSHNLQSAFYRLLPTIYFPYSHSLIISYSHNLSQYTFITFLSPMLKMMENRKYVPSHPNCSHPVSMSILFL